MAEEKPPRYEGAYVPKLSQEELDAVYEQAAMQPRFDHPPPGTPCSQSPLHSYDHRPLPHSEDRYHPYHTHTTLLPHSHHPFQTPCRPTHARQSCDALLTLTLTIRPQAMRCLR